MQMMVMDSVWLTGERRLTQPVPAPELNGWSEERRCTDRLEFITGWLKQQGISSGSFLDIGSSYGWFVSEMSKQGYKASGVEQNAALATVGPAAYGLDESAIKVKNLSRFLRSAEQKYDVVCCLSVLQDYLLGFEKMSATEFIRLVDKITGSVLFFDTAECHETRYRHSLAGWNAKYIQNWLQENTSFSKIEILGIDSDRTDLFPVRYSRHLFACSRQA
jgi:2-polyprenyl-3-methyl-5-hydroxy-6-metoxy-1,4-benzoquinol methylase